MDLHGVERLLSALARSAKLKGLYIDCPHYSPMGFWDPRKPPFSLPPRHRVLKLTFTRLSNASRPAASGDPVTGTPLGIDLRAFARLGSLWLALPYTLAVCRDLPELVAALLRTWTPTTEASVRRKLTLTPSYESDFTRAEFADVLRALGPVVEDVFGERSLDAEGEGGEEKVDQGASKKLGLMEVEMCVVEKAEMRNWWRMEAPGSFARLRARGRLEVSFEKGKSRWHQSPRFILGSGGTDQTSVWARVHPVGFWPEAQWQEDEVHPEEALAIAQHALDGVSAMGHGTGDWSGFRDSAFVSEGRTF